MHLRLSSSSSPDIGAPSLGTIYKFANPQQKNCSEPVPHGPPREQLSLYGTQLTEQVRQNKKNYCASSRYHCSVLHVLVWVQPFTDDTYEQNHKLPCTCQCLQAAVTALIGPSQHFVQAGRAQLTPESRSLAGGELLLRAPCGLQCKNSSCPPSKGRKYRIL